MLKPFDWQKKFYRWQHFKKFSHLGIKLLISKVLHCVREKLLSMGGCSENQFFFFIFELLNPVLVVVNLQHHAMTAQENEEVDAQRFAWSIHLCFVRAQ